MRAIFLIVLVALCGGRPASAESIEDRLLATFRPLVGVHEKPMGSNRGPEVDMYNRAASTDLGSPWCASVTHWGYVKNGLPAR